MANWTKIGTGVAVIAVLAAVGVGGWVWKTVDTSASDVADASVKLADFHATDAEAVKRGAYVMRLGDCAACHTAGKGDLAGDYVFKTNFGTILSSNITPDRATGIGTMTERQFFNAVRQGIGSKGMLYPAMPYTAYRKMSDQDMKDLWAYMSTVRPVKNKVDENAGMAFPYNMRIAMLGWDMLFFDNKDFSPKTGQDAELTRGQYIVDGPGHCSACHSPRNALGGEEASQYLAGGSLGTGFAPNITSNPHTGIGGQSVDALVAYLKTGANGIAVASGAMAEAVVNSTQYMSDKDLHAVASYLKSVPSQGPAAPAALPTDSPAMEQAALNYEVSCSACHGVKGEGMGLLAPAFAGNPVMQAPDASNMITALLKGGRAAATQTATTGAGMPSFAWKYSDADIANILTYVRNSWGNSAPAVDAAEVGKMRKALGAREQLAVSKP